MITITESPPGALGSQFIITGEFRPGTERHYQLYSSPMSPNAVFGGGEWCVGILLACCSGGILTSMLRETRSKQSRK